MGLTLQLSDVVSISAFVLLRWQNSHWFHWWQIKSCICFISMSQQKCLSSFFLCPSPLNIFLSFLNSSCLNPDKFGSRLQAHPETQLPESFLWLEGYIRYWRRCFCVACVLRSDCLVFYRLVKQWCRVCGKSSTSYRRSEQKGDFGLCACRGQAVLHALLKSNSFMGEITGVAVIWFAHIS